MTPLFADKALSARIERAEATHLTLGAETYAACAPDRPVAFLRVAGGAALFFGPTISLSRAVGLGMEGPVTAADIDALDEFYRSRAMRSMVLVSAHADPTLFEHLGEHGYRLVELDTVLARRIEPHERFQVPADVTIRQAAAGDAASWVSASLAGFSEPGEVLPAAHASIYEQLFQVPTTTYFFATIAGELAGTGVVDLQSGVAQLFATSTQHGARGRGVQTSLILARLAFAQAAGCDLAFLRTAAGSGSQRNAERQGFRPLYSKAMLVKQFD